jgi:hypothetical protein
MRQHRQIKHSDEQDVFTSWRHYLCYLTKAGVKANVKRNARRRERREGKIETLGRVYE